MQEVISPHKVSLCLLLLNYSDGGEDLSSETREELALFLLKEIKVGRMRRVSSTSGGL